MEVRWGGVLGICCPALSETAWISVCACTSAQAPPAKGPSAAGGNNKGLVNGFWVPMMTSQGGHQH